MGGDRQPLPWIDPRAGDVQQREALVDGGAKQLVLQCRGSSQLGHHFFH